ncbi:hypothetical protein PPUJ20005_42790 [Pseudomonas putida]|nr:hypothetical protein PPUJ20005_42790 [Pseudomonas putida]
MQRIHLLQKRKIEYCKAQTLAQVEPPFRVTNRQLGNLNVRFRELKKTRPS